MVALLLSALGVKATEIWTGSCVIGAWSGSSVTVDKAAFGSANAGDVIKVTFSNYAETESDDTTPVTYWQYSLQQEGNGWTTLTGFSGGDLTKGQKSASYTLTATNVTELQNYGLAVNGRYITVTKVELLTISTTETLWTGEQATGNWGANVYLSYENKGKLSEIFMNDIIRITYKDAGDDATVRVANPIDNEAYEASSQATATSGDDQTFDYTITSAVILEKIQQNGILGRGKNITITKIELLKVDGRYDAVPLTIGSDGIATFGSAKNLDFSGISEVTPYYVSKVNTGSVTLTSVEKTRSWVGYIVQGTPGTYAVPVNATEPDWIDDFNNLIYTGDYDGTKVYRSAYSDYSDGGDRETKIKTYYRYIFAKNNSDKIGFYKLAEDFTEGGNPYHVMSAHKAYLETSTDIKKPGQSRIALVFDDGETTGIQELENSSIEELNHSGNEALKAYYNLNGQRVANPRKGLYVVNGKKVIIK